MSIIWMPYYRNRTHYQSLPPSKHFTYLRLLVLAVQERAVGGQSHLGGVTHRSSLWRCRCSHACYESSNISTSINKQNSTDLLGAWFQGRETCCLEQLQVCQNTFLVSEGSLGIYCIILVLHTWDVESSGLPIYLSQLSFPSSRFWLAYRLVGFFVFFACWTPHLFLVETSRQTPTSSLTKVGSIIW